ncbi:hypothetical protein [Dictyobacter kobayashii]|uniref:Uncharacterized protein n=1 Tax=Dictyobacter kobayashii TaxID=2014872 RepID=A0A402AVQ4_9CHLR|nr:hypothetical protein [Dictyobacter kobayashii]GCE23196.1 hypothetical protein KDK_69960 [Dictyobacter kobayashii]
MFQTILILSPGILLSIVGFICLTLSLRNYRIQKEKGETGFNGNNLPLLIFGNASITAFFAIILFYINAIIILIIAFFCFMLLFLTGEILLHKLVIAGKEYFFASLITMLGAFLCLFLFPIITTMREPFTLIYSVLIMFLIFVQIMFIDNWKRKRLQRKRLSGEAHRTALTDD